LLEGESLSEWRHYSDVRNYKESTRSWTKWLRLIRHEIAWTMVLRIAASHIFSKVRQDWQSLRELVDSRRASHVSNDLSHILEQKLQIGLFISSTEPGYDILMAHARRTAERGIHEGLIQLQFVEGADHAFSTFRSRMDLINKLCVFLGSFGANFVEPGSLDTPEPGQPQSAPSTPRSSS
jgi:hypothetical protein